MASTFSTRLRLELIGTGNQSGSWGATTDITIGTIMEEAIAGVASVTHDDTADYTLTANNGTTDEARQAILDIGGALSQARNVVCPTQEKKYTVKNSTTGGFGFTLKTSGGSGILVPNGATMELYCDGTDVVNSVTNLPAGTTINDVAITTAANTQTLTNKTLTSPVLTTPQINDTSEDHQYIFGVSELAADRTVTLPLLTGNDTFTFNAFAATLTNKSIDLANNTMTGTLAEFNTAVSDANLQAQDDVLDDLAALSPVGANGDFIVGTGAGTYAHESAATALISMGAQAQDLVLDDLAALAAVADNEFIVGTGAGVYAHESGATARTSIGLGTGDAAAFASLTLTADLAVAEGGTGASTFTDGGVLLGSGTSAVSVTTAGNVGEVLTSTGAASDPTFQTVGSTLDTEQATTSGTDIDFTGLPSTVKRIVFQFVGVSTNGTDDLIIVLGDAGGFEETGYDGAVTEQLSGVGSNFTTRFTLTQNNATGTVLHGTVTLTLENSANNTWVAVSTLARGAANTMYFMAGSKSLTAVLTQVRLSTVGGTDAFDAGAVNILYD